MRAHVLPIAAATLALAAAAGAQVGPGRVLAVLGGGTAPSSLVTFEPLRGTLQPLDTTALGTLRISAAIAAGRGGGIALLGGGPAASTDDLLLRARIAGSTVAAPVNFAQGLRGRVVAMFDGALNGEILIVTDAALFAVPGSGGAARPFGTTIGRMGNTDAALVDPSLLYTAGVDASLAPGLWAVDLTSARHRFVPLRLPAPLAVANGPGGGTLLVGDAAGHVWHFDPATLALTPWVNLGMSPIRRLLVNPDQRHWLAATPGALHVFRGPSPGTVHPLPGLAWSLAYVPYDSGFATYGTACRGTGLLPPAIGALGRPTPGNGAFALTLSHAPGNAPIVLLLGLVAVDVGLDPFGMAGCRLFTMPVLTFGASTGNTGLAQYPLPVPPDPGLVGGRMRAQWLVRDLGANAASFTTSDGGTIAF